MKKRLKSLLVLVLAVVLVATMGIFSTDGSLLATGGDVGKSASATSDPNGEMAAGDLQTEEPQTTVEEVEIEPQTKVQEEKTEEPKEAEVKEENTDAGENKAEVKEAKEDQAEVKEENTDADQATEQTVTFAFDGDEVVVKATVGDEGEKTLSEKDGKAEVKGQDGQQVKFTVQPKDNYQIDKVTNEKNDVIAPQTAGERAANYVVTISAGREVHISASAQKNGDADKGSGDEDADADDDADADTPDGQESEPAPEIITSQVNQIAESTTNLANGIATIAGNDNGIALISITGPTEVEVGGTITLTSDVHNGSNHKWSSSDNNIATVKGSSKTSGGFWGIGGKTTYTGTVTGKTSGTVIITHTYTTGYGYNEQTHTETYEVTVTAANVSGNDSDTARFYLWKPEYQQGGNEKYTDTWEYVGTGTVKGKAQNYDVGKVLDISNVITYPTNLPEITYDGQTYTYDPTGEGGPNLYVVEWDEVVVSNGYNIGSTSYDEGKKTYHVNGRFVFPPKLEIVKTVTGTTGENGEAKEGDILNYEITVKNTGSIRLNNVELSDTFTAAGSLTWPENTQNVFDIAQNETKTFRATYTVESEDVGNTLTNTATASYKRSDKDTQKISDTVTTKVEDKAPGLTTTKVRTNNGTGEDKAFKAGETAEFDIVVKNTGNTTQHDVVVTDTMAGAKIVAGDGYTLNEDGTATITEIAPDGYVTVKAEYTVTQEDIDNQTKLANTATVKGEGTTPDPEPEPIPTEDKNPGLETTKKLTNGTNEDGSEKKFKAGETATFDIVVENTGNTTQHDVVVTDTMTGATIVAGEGYTVNADGTATIPTIEVGKSVTVKAEYTIQQADIDNQTKLANTATVAGEGENNKEPDPAPIPTEDKNPGLTATKSVTNAPAGGFKAGQTAEFDITVTNSGNTTQHDVVVTEQLEGATIKASEGGSYTVNADGTATIPTIEVGESVTVKATYTVTQDDIDSDAELKNIALVKGEGELDPTPKVEIQEEKQNPRLWVEKRILRSTDGYDTGDTITYRIYVTNTGNVTVKDIVLTDPLTGEEWKIGELKPGQKYNAGEAVVTTYEVKEADINGSIKNTATATGKDPNGDEVTGEGSVTAYTAKQNDHITITKEATSTPANGKAYDLDETISYKITVTNDGNVTEKNITVKDSLTNASWTIESLASGASREFTTDYKVTEEDIRAGHVLNEVTASGESNPEVVPGKEDEPTQAQTPSIFVEKTVTDGKLSGYKAGDTVTYTIKVQNNGNVTLTDVFVKDTLTKDYWTIKRLAPGAVETKDVEYTLTEDDLFEGKVVNKAEVTAMADGKSVTDDDTAEITTEAVNPRLKVTKRIAGTTNAGYDLNSEVRFHIYVENTGNVTLTNVLVTDEKTGDSWTIDSLAPGVTKTFDAEYTVTEADILAGEFVNEADAQGTLKDGTSVDASDSVYVFTASQTPGLTATKALTNAGSGANGAFKVGETATFDITVTNTGNVTQKNVTVSEMPGATITEGTGYTINDAGQAVITDLAPGAIVTVKATYKVKQEDIDNSAELKNIATVKGENGTNPNSEPEVVIPEEKQDPELTVEKHVYNSNNGYGLGDTVKYHIYVTNTGNVTLRDVAVTDPLTGESWTIENLVPGASEDYVTKEYTVTETDILAGEIENTATAAGKTTEGTEVEGKDSITVDTVEPNGHLIIVKKATSTPENGFAYVLGETITYEITATNVGNLTLTGVEVTDKLAGAKVLEGTGYTVTDNGVLIESLAPGASETFTAEYKVTEADVLAGHVLNEATATAISPDPDKPTPEIDPDDVTVPVVTPNAALTIVKNARAGEYKVGGTVTYDITVTNNGNVTVENVSVKDPLTGFEETGVTLAPGEFKLYTTEYTLTEADILKGKVYNMATASGTSADGKDLWVSDSETITPEAANPQLSVTKKVLNANYGYDLNGKVRYRIHVKNNGNVTLQNVSLRDPLTGEAWAVGTLTPGEEKSFMTNEYTVTERDIRAGKIVNTAYASGTTVDGRRATAQGSVPVSTAPKKGHVTITKTATSSPENGAAYALGETITYEITAKNDGNLTLTDVEVTDELAGAKVLEGTGYTVTDNGVLIESLAPGASETFTAEYKVTEADVLAGHVLNEATATGKTTDPEKPDPGIDPGEEDEPVVTPGPSVFVEKTVTSRPANGTSYVLGEEATFNIQVVNNGNVTLTDVAVTDELAGAEILAGEGYTVTDNGALIANLAPGAEVNVSARYVIQESDLIASSTFTNIATASGNAPDNTPTEPGEDETDPIPLDNEVNVTVYFVYADGTTASDTFTGTYGYGERFDVAVPEIDGYTNSVGAPRLFGDLTGDNFHDMEITVVYTPVPTEGTTPTPTPGDEDTPAPTPTPGDDGTPAPTPAAGAVTPAGGGAPAAAVPAAAAATPVAAIPDDIVPAAGQVITDEEGNVSIVPVDDEEVPLANVDLEDHDCCLFHFLVVIVILLIYGFGTARSTKKHQERINELKDSLAEEELKKKLGVGKKSGSNN